ncbi:MAG: transglycosylase domain-containing protein, partial [Caulobacteraceae bacterium]|nr:transglycosylase domain-containing protein [Caulobacter sp.]
MAVTLKLRNTSSRGLLANPILRAALIVIAAGILITAGIVLYAYQHYKGVVDDRLAAGPLFAPVTEIYAAPREIRPGQSFTVAEIAADLRRAGYGAGSHLGTYELRGDNSIFIKPGAESYHSTDGATITSDQDKITSITAENGAALAAYQLEPQLISSLSEDKGRTKRRLITYAEIPPRLVAAVTSIEDRRFFEHSGINVGRTVKCGFEDLVSARMSCGGSTITQQLARGFFLSPEKHLKRKLIEILISFQLESRFSKQQIFEMYANQINLGQRGSFAINGFGEAAQAFFGKDLKQLDLAQTALLAGMIQSPSRLNPYRHPDRAIARRNTVLTSMVETGSITTEQARVAEAEPLHLAAQNVDASDAPYFVDLVHEQLSQRLSEQDQAHTSLRIYTSLDPDLQLAAAQAVDLGMPNVDALVRKYHKAPKGGPDTPITYPQVALVALDPHTGQVLALVGGRNYGTSQYDHATAKRPTGSIFKPWVYAAAYAASLNGTEFGENNQPFTAVSTLDDEATTFTYDNGRKTYNPRNKLSGYKGDVTAIYALAHSLNNATVSLGQQVGFGNVAALARASGITAAQGTPAVALGSYDAAPLDMAGAYTVFANGGVHLNPWLLSSVRNTTGDIVSDFPQQGQQVMDPRAAFLTQSLLEGVMTFGTGSVARAHGFTAPAAGKTGTSHDVWFAGYSSNLLCVVWIGNDDYSDMGRVQGATAAAPIWADFMKRAQRLPQYSDMRSFAAPSGVQIVRLDKATNLLADSTCPDDYTAAFLDGTAPQNTCTAMNESPQNFVNRIFSDDPSPYQNSPGTPANPGQRPGASANPSQRTGASANPGQRTGSPANPYASPSSSPSPTPPSQRPGQAPGQGARPNSGQNPGQSQGDPGTSNPADTNPDGTPRKHRNFFQRLFGGGKNKKDS